MNDLELQQVVAAELARRRQAAPTSPQPGEPTSSKLDLAIERVVDRLGLPTKTHDDKPWELCTKESRRQQTLHRVSPQHQEAARLRAAGLTNVAIGKILNTSEATVSHWLQDPKIEALTCAIQSGRDQAASEAAVRIRELQMQAVETVAELLAAPAPAPVRLAAARDLLDRGGHAAPKQVQVQSVSTQLTMEDIQKLRERLQGNASANHPESCEEQDA